MGFSRSYQDDGFWAMYKRLKSETVKGFPKKYDVPNSFVDLTRSDDDDDDDNDNECFVVTDDRASRRKYPPPKNLKGFPVRRDFPPGCGKEPPCSVSKNRFLHSLSVASSSSNSLSSSEPLEGIVKGKNLSTATSGPLGGTSKGQNVEGFGMPPLATSKECEKFRDASPDDSEAITSRLKVKEALREFQELLAKLLRERERRPIWDDRPKISVYMEVVRMLRMRKKCVNIGKKLGHIPGVQVGDTFQWRAELCVVGLHHQFQGGIDYMDKDGKILATSVVASGRYDNELDDNGLIYSGHGGNPRIRSNTQPIDQKLKQGNLAMKNSMDAKTPVRVICRTKSSKMDSSGKIFDNLYVYDGLYVVDKFWQERGEFGKLIFKFRLKRIPTYEN